MRSGPVRVLAILAITACGGRGGPTTPQDRGRVRLVRCRPAPPLPTLAVESRVSDAELPTMYGRLVAGPRTGASPEDAPAAPWTPFALDAAEAANVTDRTARATEGAMRGRLAALDACFAGSPVTGSLRVMLAITSDGELASVRAGGLGDQATEACVEEAVTGMRVLLPSEASGELACDLSRGDAQPWRVTPDRGGYGVVEVSRARVRHGAQVLAAGEEPEALAADALFLLVADADAPGAMISLAMRWTAEARTTLVAVRSARPPGAAPQLLGAGQTALSIGLGDAGEDPRATLEVSAGVVTACADRWRQVARLADPAAIDAAAHQLAARCRAVSCSSALVLAVGRDAAAKDLIEVAGAARRAGFERVLLVQGAGGAAGEAGEATAGCAPGGDE